MQVTKLSLDLDLVGSESTGPKYTLVLNQTSVDGDASADKVNFLHDVLGKVVATFPNGAIEVIIPPSLSAVAASLVAAAIATIASAPEAPADPIAGAPPFATELLAAAKELRMAASALQNTRAKSKPKKAGKPAAPSNRKKRGRRKK